jgi:hypothetical protein
MPRPIKLVSGRQQACRKFLEVKRPRGGEKLMTTFDEREKAFEKKFAHDQELKFKAEARRNKLLAEWAAEKLGLSGAEVEDYIRAVVRADLAEAGDQDVFRKVRGDFDAKGVQISDEELRSKMQEFLAEAVKQVEASRT